MGTDEPDVGELSESEAHPQFCPVHGAPEGLGQAWPCPMAYEDSPPGAETCPYLVAEMERRMADVDAGNFWRVTEYDENGDRWFIGHGRLAGQTKKAWSRRDAGE